MTHERAETSRERRADEAIAANLEAVDSDPMIVRAVHQSLPAQTACERS